MAVIVLVLAVAALVRPHAAAAHPLESLRAVEISAAVDTLRAAGLATDSTRFPLIKLAPPDKSAVWNWMPGVSLPRRAFVVMRRDRQVHEAVIDLDRRRVLSSSARHGVQSNIVAEEWSRATALVKTDPRWLSAMGRRGITDVKSVFCDALSPGHLGKNRQRRLVKVPCYDAGGTTNVYGRPIEGLIATVDLDDGTVVDVFDRGAVPVSTADPSLEQEKRAALQPPLRPILATAPAGHNFTIDGGMVRWAGWSFHLSFDQRVGPTVSTVRYRDRSRERPILYQGHVAEMFVPYMDPDPNWAFRSYMDVGEYGFGTLASPLVAGSDCPAGATMLPVILPSYDGRPTNASDLMCAFERNTTLPAWRRLEIVTGAYEARPDVEFVVRTIPTVGNYDYIVDWIFNLKGEIRIDVGATGIAAAKGVRAQTAGDLPRQAHGVLVGPNLVAPNHDHFLSFRFDLDVDGTANAFVRERLERKKAAAPGNRSIWTRVPVPASTELGVDPGHMPELWRVENRSMKTALGHAPSYEIAGHGATSLLPPDDPAQRRAGFSALPLWVTRYRASELYAAGDYPNQSAGGEGLPRYVNGERVAGDDLVVWYTLGFHHVTRPEDWPVLPTVRHSVTLRPHRFFDRNPAMTVPRDFAPAQPERRP